MEKPSNMAPKKVRCFFLWILTLQSFWTGQIFILKLALFGFIGIPDLPLSRFPDFQISRHRRWLRSHWNRRRTNSQILTWLLSQHTQVSNTSQWLLDANLQQEDCFFCLGPNTPPTRINSSKKLDLWLLTMLANVFLDIFRIAGWKWTGTTND